MAARIGRGERQIIEVAYDFISGQFIVSIKNRIAIKVNKNVSSNKRIDARTDRTDLVFVFTAFKIAINRPIPSFDPAR